MNPALGHSATFLPSAHLHVQPAVHVAVQSALAVPACVTSRQTNNIKTVFTMISVAMVVVVVLVKSSFFLCNNNTILFLIYISALLIFVFSR